MRGRKLSPGSTRDTDWQRQEYERMMGQEAADRQELAAREERGDCVCNRRTIKNRRGIRTIHEIKCSKYKPWMEEYQHIYNNNSRADAYIRSMK